jgi:ketosteroid isomerase-like protein
MLPLKPDEWPNLFERHLNAGDLDAVAALYDVNATLVSKSGETIRGRDAIRAVLAGLIDGKARPHGKLVKEVRAGDTAVLYTDWHGTIAGEEQNSRAIKVLRRSQDGAVGRTRPGAAIMLLRSVLSLAGFALFLGVVLFLPAGDLWWANGWLFIAVFTALTVPSIAYLWRVNPDNFEARSRIHGGTKGWNLVLVTLLLAAFFSIFPLAGLDRRFGWSSVPPWLAAVGYALTAVGYLGSVWVYGTNKFAEPTVRIQAERGRRWSRPAPTRSSATTSTCRRSSSSPVSRWRWGRTWR